MRGFVNGGALPTIMRGTRVDALMHVADFYATLAGLAGVDPSDDAAAVYELPAIDSIDMWPVLSGAVDVSPRTELPLSLYEDADGVLTGALIVDERVCEGHGVVVGVLGGADKPLRGAPTPGRAKAPEDCQAACSTSHA